MECLNLCGLYAMFIFRSVRIKEKNNTIALRTAKTLCFGCSECNRVKSVVIPSNVTYAIKTDISADIKFFKKLEDKKERETGTLQLDCKASNPNSAPVKWFKDGNPINSDDP